MHVQLLLAIALVAQLSGANPRYTEENGNPVMDGCLIKPPADDDIRISAPEAGVLMKMPLTEGSHVAKGDLLALIDDREAKGAKQVAIFAFESAEQKANEDIEIKYAKAAADVAQVDLEQNQKANQVQPGAIPDIEIRKGQLDVTRAKLQTEKAQKDQILARLEAKTKAAERDAAQLALDIRTILAPFDGEVVTVFRHEGEWVSPGDPILKLTQLERLYVEGIAYASQFDRGELVGKPVSVKVKRARGREVSVTGRVIYVEQSVQADGSYRVRAEVKNEREGDGWLIQPGLPARMTVLLHGK